MNAYSEYGKIAADYNTSDLLMLLSHNELRRVVRWILTMSVTIAFAFELPALALAPDFGLVKGIEHREVMTLKGEPTEKIEMESRREELWRYPGVDLIFHEGKLRDWKVKGQAGDRTAQQSVHARQAPTPGQRAAPSLLETQRPDARRANALLGDILRELPAEGRSEGSSSSNQPHKGMPRLPR